MVGYACDYASSTIACHLHACKNYIRFMQGSCKCMYLANFCFKHGNCMCSFFHCTCNTKEYLSGARLLQDSVSMHLHCTFLQDIDAINKESRHLSHTPSLYSHSNFIWLLMSYQHIMLGSTGSTWKTLWS